MTTTTQTERDSRVLASLAFNTNRYGSCNIHTIADEAKISEGQTIASLKRLKATGDAEQVTYGWRAAQKVVR